MSNEEKRNPYVLKIEQLEKNYQDLKTSFSEAERQRAEETGTEREDQHKIIEILQDQNRRLKDLEQRKSSVQEPLTEKPSVHPDIPSYMTFCPTCGKLNPSFKDEVKCSNCGMHLGETEEAKKLEACPNCGARGKVLERV